MESFAWGDYFVTGLAEVDRQHHHLVDVINRYGELLMRREGALAADTEVVFGELAAYADYHFREEEQLMERGRIDPRHVARHRQEHASFLQDVTRMHSVMSAADRSNAESLLLFLTHWLAYHILGSDQMMAHQIAAIAAGATPEDAYRADAWHQDPATAALLHALNGLFHQVSERNRALFELNQTLEAKVAERTRELSLANRRLEEIAMTDVLTGLPNRRQGLLSLEHEWNVSLRHKTPLACMMIDADGFKAINDSYGHDAGDAVLRRLSQRLRQAVRRDDVVCRFGGDEFLIICARTPFDGAMQMAENLRHAVNQMRVPAGGGEWRGSVSIGVALRDDGMKEIEDLIKLADEGVYRAKREGRNRVATTCPAIAA
ncbi:MAG: diguanylate cyclase [Rhodocyclales bacterium]|nr:diguanylate cyclase [Rhodocyclales bacterium]